VARTVQSDEHIVVEHVSKSFGDVKVLRDVNMLVRRSEVGVIIGGSGAGKTTLLKLLIGLDKPTTGAIYINGQDIAPLGDRPMNEVRRKFGMVFQYAALLDSLSVMDNVAFPLREHTKFSNKEIRARVLEKLKILELAGTEERFPSELSGGMRKRVALARALMLDPEIIVYDEPTSGLDPVTSRLVDELILQTRDRFGVTSVVITHDMAGALRMADKVFLLAEGKLVAEGSPRDFIRSDDRLVSDFIESSAIATERFT